MASTIFKNFLIESPTKTINETETNEFQTIKKQKRKNIDRSPQNIEENSKKSRKSFPSFGLVFKQKTTLEDIENDLNKTHKELFNLCKQKNNNTFTMTPTSERELNICLLDFTPELKHFSKKFLITNENKFSNKYAINKIQIDISMEEVDKTLKYNNILAINLIRETNYFGTITTLITFESTDILKNTKFELYEETRTIRKFTPKALQRCSNCQRYGHSYKN